MANAQKKYDDYDQENNDPRLVDVDFVENQGLSAKATSFDTKRGAANAEKFQREEAANEVQYQEQIAIAEEAAEARDIARRTMFRKMGAIRKQRAVGVTRKAKSAAGLARWGGITIAVTAWFWQMLAGMVSLVGFGGRGAIDYFLNETAAGKIFGGTIGYFINLHSYIPFDSFAMAFWALATIIGVCTYFGFLLFFTLTGAKPFHSTISYLIGALTFACCILPVANLFPAVVVWVIYINITSVFKTV